MPIIVKGQLHDPTTPIVEATERPITVSFVVPESTEITNQEIQKETKEVNDHHHMVVNGTKKKLGVKSSYLLDLLTIE